MDTDDDDDDVDGIGEKNPIDGEETGFASGQEEDGEDTVTLG